MHHLCSPQTYGASDQGCAAQADKQQAQPPEGPSEQPASPLQRTEPVASSSTSRATATPAAAAAAAALVPEQTARQGSSGSSSSIGSAAAGPAAPADKQGSAARQPKPQLGTLRGSAAAAASTLAPKRGKPAPASNQTRSQPPVSGKTSSAMQPGKSSSQTRKPGTGQSRPQQTSSSGHAEAAAAAKGAPLAAANPSSRASAAVQQARLQPAVGCSETAPTAEMRSVCSRGPAAAAAAPAGQHPAGFREQAQASELPFAQRQRPTQSRGSAPAQPPELVFGQHWQDASSAATDAQAQAASVSCPPPEHPTADSGPQLSSPSADQARSVQPPGVYDPTAGRTAPPARSQQCSSTAGTPAAAPDRASQQTTGSGREPAQPEPAPEPLLSAQVRCRSSSW